MYSDKHVYYSIGCLTSLLSSVHTLTISAHAYCPPLTARPYPGTMTTFFAVVSVSTVSGIVVAVYSPLCNPVRSMRKQM
jgi:hypothetical protein